MLKTEPSAFDTQGADKTAFATQIGGKSQRESAFSHQVAGTHYAKYAIQPLEFIVKNNIGFLEGNVIKYVVRWKDKAGLEDLKKARHYLDMLIELEEEKNDLPF